MVVFRFLGVLSIMVAMFALTVDAVRSLAGGDMWVSTPLGKSWYAISSASLNTAQAAIERHLHPWLWDPAIATVLQIPTWAFFTALGLLLYWIGRRRRRMHVYSM